MLSEINFQTNQVNHLQEQIITLQAKITSLENLKKDQLSIAIVSGDMDKILAAMVISLGPCAWAKIRPIDDQVPYEKTGCSFPRPDVQRGGRPGN